VALGDQRGHGADPASTPVTIPMTLITDTTGVL